MKSEPGADPIAPEPLDIVCWRYTPAGPGNAATDQFNADGRALVSGTVYNGHAAIRCAFDNWMTTAADVEILQSTVRDIGATLLAE